MSPSFLDRAIAIVSPRMAADRLAQRARYDVMAGRSAGAQRGYQAASRKRLLSGWEGAVGTGDSALRSDSWLLRSRSRDLDRNNAFANIAATRHADYIVGTGITARSRTGRKRLDRTVDRLWATACREFDPERRLGFDAIVHRAVRSMIVDGEVLIRRRDRRRSDGLLVPLQLQILVPEFLDQTKHGVLSPGGRAVNGIEFDALGARVGYHLFPTHPHDAATLASLTSSQVPSSEIIHLFEAREDQTRGSPWLASVMIDLLNLDEYTRAEILRKKTESCLVAIVTQDPDEADADSPERLGAPPLQHGSAIDEGVEGGPPENLVDGSGDDIERFEPGMIYYAPPNRKVTFSTPSHPIGVEEFHRVHLRRIAAGARIPYELLTNDLSQVTFASGKMGQLAYQRFVRTMQWNLVVPIVCQRIWDWFIDAAITHELLPEGAYPVEWTTPRFESITPIDDVRADLMEVRAGFKSWDEAVTERGYDPDAVMAQSAARNRRFDAAGIVSDADPRRVSINGQAQTEARDGDE